MAQFGSRSMSWSYSARPRHVVLYRLSRDVGTGPADPTTARPTIIVTNKILYAHIIPTFVNVKWTAIVLFRKMHTLWSVDSQEIQWVNSVPYDFNAKMHQIRFLLGECLHIFGCGALGDKYKLIRFWGQKVKVVTRPYTSSAHCRVLRLFSLPPWMRPW